MKFKSIPIASASGGKIDQENRFVEQSPFLPAMLFVEEIMPLITSKTPFVMMKPVKEIYYLKFDS